MPTVRDIMDSDLPTVTPQDKVETLARALLAEAAQIYDSFSDPAARAAIRPVVRSVVGEARDHRQVQERRDHGEQLLEDGSTRYLVMEGVDGPSLTEVMAERKLSTAEVRR